MNTSSRPLTLRSIAESAASHPRMEAAVVSAVVAAVRSTLPDVIHSLMSDHAATQYGTLRLYQRKIPPAQRQERDRRILAMLQAGIAPEMVALEVKCSRAHVYSLRKSKSRP